MKRRDHRPLAALENDPSIGRETAGEMNAEVSGVLLKSAMNFVAILTVRNHAPLAQSGGSIKLAIFEKQPLIRVFGFYFFFAD
jgi:hypothetical protein